MPLREARERPIEEIKADWELLCREFTAQAVARAGVIEAAKRWYAADGVFSLELRTAVERLFEVEAKR